MQLQGRNLSLRMRGDDIKLLQRELRQLGFAVDTNDGTFGAATRQAVLDFQKKHALQTTGVVDARTAAAINLAVDAVNPTAGDGVSYTVDGTVASPDRAGVGGLRVQIVDRNVGQDVPLADTVTDARGRYQISFVTTSLTDRHKAKPDLQARVYSGQTWLASSDVRYNATGQETLDVQLPANSRALPSEYETLSTAVAANYAGRLSDLRESDGRQDITYLANKTGWDARAVALAALADQFSLQTAGPTGAPMIPSAFFYALFRAGLPADAATLYSVDLQTVERALKQALDQGVIPSALQNDLPRAQQAFQSLSAAHTLDSAAFNGTSTLKDMLQLAIGDDARRQQFATLSVQYRGDFPKLWDAVRQAFGDDLTKRLQLHGQLGYLTLNNAPLISRLLDAEGRTPWSSMLDLVKRGYYRADKWASLVDGAVPDSIPGEIPNEKRANYAELLAAQLRLSFPTAVIAQMVQSGEMPLGVAADVQQSTYAFLAAHQGMFEIGVSPIDQYLVRNGLTAQIPASVKEQIKRLQRVYQITPTDEAMAVLLRNNLDSAYRVVRYDRAEFVNRYGGDLGGERQAQLIYAKARLVHSAVVNIAGSYGAAIRSLTLGSDSSAPILNPAPIGTQAANASDVIAYPTLEGLFSSVDYCACDACRSILSPAAYLVDLLHFIDIDPPPNGTNPLSVLLERRPDIQALPLTCENTNSPLPYIDIVNETLEYFVANNLSLADYAGHDSGDPAMAPDALATPQYTKDAPYDLLKTQLFPSPLPFDRSLENLRRLYARFGVSLAEVMEALRADEAVERATAKAYGWRDILMEQLTLSRAEYTLLTDRTLTLQQLYGFPPGTADAQVLASLAAAKAFSRRSGITYTDVVALLKTRFINPHRALIPLLERLGVPFSTLKALKDGAISDAEFDSLLPAGLDPAEYGGDIKAWVKSDDIYARIMGLITIANPTNSIDLCSFDDLQFRYANPDNAANAVRPIDYVRLSRVVRLWRKLGWSLEQTDSAIAALSPLPDGADEMAHLDEAFVALLPRLGVVRQVMTRLNLAGATDLTGLLSCWSAIDVTGDPSLSDLNGTLTDHSETLRAAFRLTGEELSLILTALGFDVTTALSLENISAIYRRGWLARALRLSVRELLLLIGFTGLDPFAPPDPPLPPILRFIDFVLTLRSAGLTAVQVLYLIWNKDLSGTSAPDKQHITRFARTLRTDFAAIESTFAVVDDPSGDVARSRMTLVYGADAADFFFSLLENSFTIDVPYSAPLQTLDQPLLDTSSGRIGYDDFRKRLSYLGVLTTATRDALKAAAGPNGALKAAVDALYTKNQSVVAPFFDQHADLQALWATYSASTDPLAQKRTTLLTALLSELKGQRKREQALAAMGAATNTDAAFVRAVLDDAAVLHAVGNNARSALDDLLSLETSTGPVITPVWSGYLEAPETGFYNIAFETDAGATVTLMLDETKVELAQDGNTWTNQNAIALNGGILYPISLQVESGALPVAVRWETTGRGWEMVPWRYLYSATLVEHLESVDVRYWKVTALATTLRLSANEIAHLAADADYRIGGEAWLNALPVSGSPNAGTAQALSKVLEALLTFARLKAGLAPDDERLLSVLQHPKATLPNGDSLLLTVTGWQTDSVDALLMRFAKSRGDLVHLATFARVHEAYAIVTTSGVSASSLLTATTNAPEAGSVRNFQSALRARYSQADWLAVAKSINDQMRALQRDALVAYVLRRLGENQTTSHIDTADKLFEYFLMDVQMEPCMQTSRIRHALSSVQLFVERCLMNLERTVTLSSTKAAQWQWMKRYRLWEANRKVFLWPENWLEPELRDDQSPFFKETISELLQSDITDDSAEIALLDYLSKLEEVAKLEPCGIHYVASAPSAADDVVYVVARTAGAHRKYYSRRREFGSWSPWDQIKLDIEDNPVIPAVWKDRLFLFWLRIQKRAPAAVQTPGTGNQKAGELKMADIQSEATTVDAYAVLCWSEYYNGKWQPAKTSDVDRPTRIGSFPPSGPDAFDRSRLVLSVAEDQESDALRVVISGNAYSKFLLYNTHSLPVRREDDASPLIPPSGGETRYLETQGSTFSIVYEPDSIDPGFSHGELKRDLFTNNVPDHTIETRHAVQSARNAPFFYEDSRHVFYVTTTEKVVTVSTFTGYGVAGHASAIGISPLVLHGVSEDANIVTAVGIGGSVRYDGKAIGPAGILAPER